ncbi:MAG TPA: aminotransferase class I/II-fold pyridoxal phosphate-dependent enzyme [Acidimicrobiales bacterium]|nr:aminotransferase class I/II-fold pyridoxal phosphate-dependent enzyme [Acidimicrobiales bacterium]
MSWACWAEDESSRIHAAGRWRRVRTWDFDRLVSFASNDYLGLSAHPAPASAACEAARRWGTGAGASRLVVGSRPVHDELEAALAAWKGAEAALLFPAGYAANVGVLTTFGAEGVRILSDELNHASIVDGCRLARADVAVYRHLDLDHLSSLLSEGRRSIVVSDSVFSMDGDVAPVDELVHLCADHDALLVLDEAHAVLGPHLTAPDGPVLRVGTLSKALGAQGGFVVGQRRYIDLLVNRARPFVFSTALAPPMAAAALAALRVVQSAEGEELIARLRTSVERVAPGRPSPIVPIVLGEEAAAVAASAALLAHGIVVPAIRPPTVPAGTSRLRVSLSAAHTDDEVARLVEALCACC